MTCCILWSSQSMGSQSQTQVSDWAQNTQSYLKDILDSLLISSFYLFLQARILERVASSLLQGIFPTQGSNPGLPHWRQILYQLGLKGSPIYTYPFLDPSSRYFYIWNISRTMYEGWYDLWPTLLFINWVELLPMALKYTVFPNI